MAGRREILQIFDGECADDQQHRHHLPLFGITERKGQADEKIGGRTVDIDRGDRVRPLSDRGNRSEDDEGKQQPGERFCEFEDHHSFI